MTYDDAFMDGYYSALEDMDDDYSYEGYYDDYDYYDEYDPAYEEYMDGYYAAMEDAAARAAANGNKAAHDYYVKSVEKPENSLYTNRRQNRVDSTKSLDVRSEKMKDKLHRYFRKDSTILKHAGLNKKEKMIKYRHEKLGENIPYEKRESYIHKQNRFVNGHVPRDRNLYGSKSTKNYFGTNKLGH